MPGFALTVASTIMCPHGGQAILLTANARALATTAMLLETDVHAVVGCPFTIGPKYSPCVRIEWSAGASTTSVNGTPVLVPSSIGKCLSPESAPQGLAIAVVTQTRVMAR